MNIVSRFETVLVMLNLVSLTRMLKIHGEGELGIKSQGRFRFLSFSQETYRTGQLKPGNGYVRPDIGELSAGRTPSTNSTPQFFLLSIGILLMLVPTQGFGANTAEQTSPSERIERIERIEQSERMPAAAIDAIRAPATGKALPFAKHSLRRKAITAEDQKKRVRDAAEQYEKYFLREMMKAMRATVGGQAGILPTNPGEKLFREQLDDEYVEKWSQRGGVGYADIIYDQIVQRYGPQLGISKPEPLVGKLPGSLVIPTKSRQ